MVFLIILLILAIIAWVAAAFVPEVGPNDDTIHPRKYVRVAALIFTGLFVLIFIFSSFVQVGTKDVGIETTFGRTSGHLSNGLHLKWPWQNVTSMDAAIQTDSYTSGKTAIPNNATSSPCLDVRIYSQQTACVDVSIRWRIEPSLSDDLFQNYRTFDNVRDSLVTRELKAALNEQLGNYNPLACVGSSDPACILTVVATRVTKQMQREIGGQGIDVLNTIIPIMSFDPSTQNRLNQLQQQEAQTRIAQAEIATNQAQSAANQALAASIQNSPEVLTSKCLDIMKAAFQAGQKVPIGMCALGNAPSVLASGG